MICLESFWKIGRRTRASGQHAAGQEDAGQSTQLNTSAGRTCPPSLCFASRWGFSAQPRLHIPLPNPAPPHMQACAEEVSTQGWRPHGWRELNN